MTKDEDKRRFGRIHSKVRCEFIERKKIDTFTVNVSRNGIFVADTTERHTNNLVRLKLYPPPDNKPIEIFGRVAWKGNVRNQNGYGIQFLKLDSNDRNQWVEYVAQVETLDGGHSASSHHHSPTAAAPEKRTSPRSKASFMVRFRTAERLEQFVSHNLSEGGMFLSTPVLRATGDRVQVVLVHPETDEDFEIEAEVAHVNPVDSEEGKKGMGLKFISLSEESKVALDAFIKSKKKS
jgi:uncharacterized protein (TIGR02266 family)